MAIENFDQVTIAPAKLRPFSKFIMSIGELPTSYLDSLSYAEQVTWFCDYLQNHVIPAINNNGEAVEELQNAYTSFTQAVNDEIERFENNITTEFNNLEDFVNNYFENNFPALVQDTLDEMAENGTLENLLNDAAHLTKSYNTYTDLIADSENFTNGLRLKTLGYYEVNDGGAAEYIITNTANNTKYQVELSNDLYLELINKGIINIKQLGAYGDGEHDDTNALQNALNYFKKIELNYNDIFTISSSLLIKSNTILDGKNATINNPLKGRTIKKYGDSVSNIIIKNIKFVGNNDELDPSEWPDNNSAIVIATNCNNIIVDKCSFKNFPYGVFLGGENGKNCNITNCYFENCSSAIDTFCNIGLVENNYFYNCETPIQLEPNTGVYAENITINNNITKSTTGDRSINLHTRNKNTLVINNNCDKSITITGSDNTNVRIENNITGDITNDDSSKGNTFGGETYIHNNTFYGICGLESNFIGDFKYNKIVSQGRGLSISSSNTKVIGNEFTCSLAVILNGGTGTLFLIDTIAHSGTSLISNATYTDIVFKNYVGTLTVSQTNIIDKLNSTYKYYT